MHMRMYVNKILILRMMGLHLISLSDTRSSSSSSSIRRLRIRVVVVAAIIFFFYFVDCRCLGNTFWRLCWHVVASMMNEVHDGVFIKKNIYIFSAQWLDNRGVMQLLHSKDAAERRRFGVSHAPMH